MLQVVTYENGKREVHDLEALPLNGTLAHKLDQARLARELMALGVEGVTTGTAKQDALLAYSRYRIANDCADKEFKAANERLASQRIENDRTNKQQIFERTNHADL